MIKVDKIENGWLVVCEAHDGKPKRQWACKAATEVGERVAECVRSVNQRGDMIREMVRDWPEDA